MSGTKTFLKMTLCKLHYPHGSTDYIVTVIITSHYIELSVNRSFLHPVDPFSVPSHLREQVAGFEDQYNSTRRHRGQYKKVLDNHPDPTKESLYE